MSDTDKIIEKLAVIEERVCHHHCADLLGKGGVEGPPVLEIVGQSGSYYYLDVFD